MRDLFSEREVEQLTTRQMVGKLEWSVASWQGVTAGISLTVDHYRPGWPTVAIAVIAGLNVASVPLIARFGGPFSRGPAWIMGALALVVLVPAFAALAVVPGSYGAQAAATPLCNYPAATMVLLAFYPWWRGERTVGLAFAEYLYVLVVTVLPTIALLVVDPVPDLSSYRAAAFGGSYNVLGYLLGKAIGLMCRVAARRQTEVQQQSYEEFFNFLHSHVKAGVAAVRAESPDLAAMHTKLGELEQAVSDRRVQFLLAQRAVPLAALISERIRTFNGVLRLTETPRTGAMTVRRPVGILVSRALGDLLKNAVVHGATSAAVRLEDTRSRLVLQVQDDGPGFASSVLHDESNSLFRLRRAALDAGGDLVADSVAGGGAVVTMDLPLHEESRRGPGGARAAR